MFNTNKYNLSIVAGLTLRDIIKNQIDLLRSCPTENFYDYLREVKYVFNNICIKYILKIIGNFWGNHCPDFEKYFSREYENTLDGWQSFLKYRAPSTNNNIEARNRVIKLLVTGIGINIFNYIFFINFD